MDPNQDSIEKLLSDLPQYTEEDFMNNIPYERAARVCLNREEIEECLEKIYEAANKLNIDNNLLDYLDHIYMEDFLVSIGEKEPEIEPPEYILEC